MILGLFHAGSGLGDQLFRYITVRTLAEEKGWEWDMAHAHNFKGQSFLKNLEIKGDYPQDPIYKTWNERELRDEKGVDIRSYDPEINFIEDWTVIDGSFEDDKYWGHNLENISRWLRTDFHPDYNQKYCVIGFRGGEYASDKDLFLTKDYYDQAIAKMRELGVTKFEVHTDDPELARSFFPGMTVIDNKPISHSLHTNIGFNWCSTNHAQYAIIPNSAFFIMPRLLRHYSYSRVPAGIDAPKPVTIAPRYWARRNTKIWARPACYYKPFTYL